MSKKVNIVIVIILSVLTVLIVSSKAQAGGPFSNKNKLGDVMMVMSPTYALGMTIMAKDWEGTLQLGESVILSQLASEGIKTLEIEERPNGNDKKSFPSGHAVGAFSGANKYEMVSSDLVPQGALIMFFIPGIDRLMNYIF